MGHSPSGALLDTREIETNYTLKAMDPKQHFGKLTMWVSTMLGVYSMGV